MGWRRVLSRSPPAHAGDVHCRVFDKAHTDIYTLSLHDALPIRVVLAEDNLLVREGLRQLLATVEDIRSEEHTSELQSHSELVCRLLLEKKKMTRSWRYQKRDQTGCNQAATVRRCAYLYA